MLAVGLRGGAFATLSQPHFDGELLARVGELPGHIVAAHSRCAQVVSELQGLVLEPLAQLASARKLGDQLADAPLQRPLGGLFASARVLARRRLSAGTQ
ncbi:MAG: hypothetical protein JSS46_10495 [Proteobacteria bacterium]|jgi:hypothetical protein|nr:hypothetical protein [Pseudomonadota bacterium]